MVRRMRHHRLRTPWGYVGLASQRHPPEVVWTSLRAVSHRNVVAPVPDKMPGTTSNKPSAISRRVRQQAPRVGWAFSAARTERGWRRRASLSGCWSCDLAVVRRVAGTATGVAGSWFGVWAAHTLSSEDIRTYRSGRTLFVSLWVLSPDPGAIDNPKLSLLGQSDIPDPSSLAVEAPYHLGDRQVPVR
jgi:hypothetical protein